MKEKAVFASAKQALFLEEFGEKTEKPKICEQKRNAPGSTEVLLQQGAPSIQGNSTF